MSQGSRVRASARYTSSNLRSNLTREQSKIALIYSTFKSRCGNSHPFEGIGMKAPLPTGRPSPLEARSLHVWNECAILLVQKETSWKRYASTDWIIFHGYWPLGCVTRRWKRPVSGRCAVICIRQRATINFPGPRVTTCKRRRKGGDERALCAPGKCPTK